MAEPKTTDATAPNLKIVGATAPGDPNTKCGISSPRARPFTPAAASQPPPATRTAGAPPPCRRGTSVCVIAADADVGCVWVSIDTTLVRMQNLLFVYVHAAMRAASIRLSWAVEPRSRACVCVPSVEFCYWWALMERGELVVDHHLQSMDYRHYYRKCGRDRLAHGSLGFGSN